MGQTFKVLWQPYILLSAYELVLASLFLVLSISDLTLYPSGEFSNDNSEKQLNSVEHISCYYLYNVTIQKLAQNPLCSCLIHSILHSYLRNPQMFSQQQIALVLSKIEQIAELKHLQDDDDFENAEFYNPADNGNFDDAFEDGVSCGRIDFARELMVLLTSDT